MSSVPDFSVAPERHAASLTSDGSILTRIHGALKDARIDAKAELYNEALHCASAGHYGEARNHLHVLLGLNPSDGEAHLLLGKILVAGQQWRRALATLDEAAQCGAKVPAELRERVTAALQAEGERDEDEATRQLREQGELKKLRADVRRFRSENAHLAATNRGLQKEAARWAWVATGTSLVAIAVIVGRMMFAGGEPAPVAAAPIPEAPATAAAAVAEVAPAAASAAAEAPVAEALPSARNSAASEKVLEALSSAGFPEVAVVVRGGRASLSGVVPHHAALKEVVAVAAAVEGIDEVLADGLENKLLRKGGTHVVAPGESLSVIAHRAYGNQALATEILAANPKLGGKPNLQVGMELILPAVK